MDLDRSEIEYQYHCRIIVDRIILKITIIIYKLIVSSQTSEKFLRDTTFLQTKFKVQNGEPRFKSLTSIHKTNPLPAMHRNSVEPVAIRTQNQDVSCRRKDPRTAHAARRGPSCVMLITSTRGTASDDDTVSLDDPRDKMSRN